MSDLDPERFTLRQASQARDDFAQIMDELDFVNELLARLPKMALIVKIAAAIEAAVAERDRRSHG